MKKLTALVLICSLLLSLPGCQAKEEEPYIPTGDAITPEKLSRTEEAEGYLHSLGLRDFRVRTLGDTARIQVTESDLETVLNNREAIVSHLKTLYSGVTLDLEVRP